MSPGTGAEGAAAALASGTASTDDTTAGTSSGTSGTSSGTGSGTDGSGGAAGSDGSDEDASGTADSGTEAGTGTGGSSGTTTYTGAAVATRYGDVQVEITVTDGVLTAARAVEYPDRDRHDQQINAYAIPVLEERTVATQGSVDLVTGATVTSRGYAQSLQDALDQAAL